MAVWTFYRRKRGTSTEKIIKQKSRVTGKRSKKPKMSTPRINNGRSWNKLSTGAAQEAGGRPLGKNLISNFSSKPNTISRSRKKSCVKLWSRLLWTMVRRRPRPKEWTSSIMSKWAPLLRKKNGLERSQYEMEASLLWNRWKKHHGIPRRLRNSSPKKKIKSCQKSPKMTKNWGKESWRSNSKNWRSKSMISND